MLGLMKRCLRRSWSDEGRYRRRRRRIPGNPCGYWNSNLRIHHYRRYRSRRNLKDIRTNASRQPNKRLTTTAVAPTAIVVATVTAAIRAETVTAKAAISAPSGGEAHPIVAGACVLVLVRLGLAALSTDFVNIAQQLHKLLRPVAHFGLL